MHALNRQGTDLLAAITRGDDPDAAQRFDALFYELVWRYLREHHAVLGARVARYLGVDGVVAPAVEAREVEEVAHDATSRALRRVRQNASRFDPTRGEVTHWVIGAAEFAYIEVAKEIAKARRSPELAFVDPYDLLDVPSASPTTEEHVLKHLMDEEALGDAARHLTFREFAALRLCITAGYSYAEAAEKILGDPQLTKQIDGLLTRGKAKLAAAWSERRPSSRQVPASQVFDAADD